MPLISFINAFNHLIQFCIGTCTVSVYYPEYVVEHSITIIMYDK